MKELISGYHRFHQNYLHSSRDLFKTLVEQGQNPKALIIGCCDSRVDPTIIFDCSPGDLFVVRNVANLVPPYEDDKHYHGTSAALEFGICNLKIPNIIILGHSHCGGIRSLLSQDVNNNLNNPNNLSNNARHNNNDQSNVKDKEGEFISKWMNLVNIPSQEEMKQYKNLNALQIEELYGKRSLIGSLRNLTTFPWIAERRNNKILNVYGWYFKLENGTIDEYNSNTGHFQPLNSEYS